MCVITPGRPRCIGVRWDHDVRVLMSLSRYGLSSYGCGGGRRKEKRLRNGWRGACGTDWQAKWKDDLLYSVGECYTVLALLAALRDTSSRSELLAARGGNAVASAQDQEAPFELISHSCHCLHCFCCCCSVSAASGRKSPVALLGLLQAGPLVQFSPQEGAIEAASEADLPGTAATGLTSSQLNVLTH